MANTTLNTGTSIVDYLKSTGGDSSFATRAKLAAANGIANYTGSADQNTQLLTLVQKGAKTTAPPATTTTPADASGLINGNQESDQKKAASQDQPGTSSGAQALVDSYKALAEAIKPTTTAPTAPNLTKTYSDLRASMGVDDLESSITDLNAQKAAIQGQFQVQYDAETGKPVAMNVIEGRVSEEEKAANQRITAIDAQIATANSQLTTKYNVINSLMTYTNQDYTNAKAQYDSELSQNLSMIQLAKGVQDTADTEEENAKDDARANLQIIYNNIAAKGGSTSTIDDQTKTTITKLELQAGLPQGFYETIASDNPGGTVLSTTTRDADGVKYADVIVRNSDGSLSTNTVKLGASSTGTKDLTDAQQTKADAASVASQLDTVAGADGYVAPSDYLKARKAWVASGYDAADFDDRFAKTYVNPTQYAITGVTAKSTI